MAMTSKIAYKILNHGTGDGPFRVWSYGPGLIVVVPVNTPYLSVHRLLPKEDADIQILMDLDPRNETVILDADDLNMMRRRKHWTKDRTRSYVIPHGSASFAGRPLALRKILKDLTRLGLVEGSYRLVNSPEWQGKTVADVVGIAPMDLHDPVQEVAQKSTGKLTLYHGTSAKRWEGGVKTQGLRPGKTPKAYGDLVKDYSDHNIYLTTSIPVAENYATRASIEDRSKAVVLAVEINDFSKFLLDEDSGGPLVWGDNTYYFRHGEWRELPDAPAIFAAFQAKTLQGLKSHKTVAYRGAIPATKLKVVEVYKPSSMSEEPDTHEYSEAVRKTRDTIKWSPKKVASAARVARCFLGG